MLPVLRTKTSIPAPRTNRVGQTRLIERVNAGMTRPLTLVVAPAGFGKTTLIANWARLASTPTAWLSLECADHPPNALQVMNKMPATVMLNRGFDQKAPFNEPAERN